jgi:hypothetical protein
LRGDRPSSLRRRTTTVVRKSFERMLILVQTMNLARQVYARRCDEDVRTQAELEDLVRWCRHILSSKARA